MDSLIVFLVLIQAHGYDKVLIWVIWTTLEPVAVIRLYPSYKYIVALEEVTVLMSEKNYPSQSQFLALSNSLSCYYLV